MPEVIYTYEDFISYNNRVNNSLFWIIEYQNAEEPERYSLLRNECLKHPNNFKDRLNNKIYRIWTTTPIDIPW